MSSDEESPVQKEIAEFESRCERLGSSARDELMRERLTTAIDALELLSNVQGELDWLLLCAEEDADRLADKILDIERKSPDYDSNSDSDYDSNYDSGSNSDSDYVSEPDPDSDTVSVSGYEPQLKRPRHCWACNTAPLDEELLEVVKAKHSRAAERVRQIRREYAAPLAQAEAAADKARRDFLELEKQPSLVSKEPADREPSPTSGPSSTSTSNNNNYYASAEDAASQPADVSEDESLLALTGLAAGTNIDMTRRLSQSFQGRKLDHIHISFKTTYATTWNDGTRDVKVVLKATPRSDARRILAARHEIAAYHRLRPLQGTCIPRLLDYGRTEPNGEKCFGIVMERIEDRDLGAQKMLDFRPSIGKLSDQERAACRDVIRKIHDLGVVHRDIRGGNLMFRDNLPGPN
ncbi:hypothetical protein H4R18_005591, partial [Coemansia javaensis]